MQRWCPRSSMPKQFSLARAASGDHRAAAKPSSGRWGARNRRCGVGNLRSGGHGHPRRVTSLVSLVLLEALSVGDGNAALRREEVGGGSFFSLQHGRR